MKETDERRAFEAYWIGSPPRGANEHQTEQHWATWQAARAAVPASPAKCPNCGSTNTAPTAGNAVGNTMDCLVCHTDFTPAPSPVAAPPAGQTIRVEDSNGRIRVHVGDVEYVPLDAVPGWFEIAAAPVPPSASDKQDGLRHRVATLEKALRDILEIVSQQREPGWSYRNTITTNRNWIKKIIAAALPSAPQETER